MSSYLWLFISILCPIGLLMLRFAYLCVLVCFGVSISKVGRSTYLASMLVCTSAPPQYIIFRMKELLWGIMSSWEFPRSVIRQVSRVQSLWHTNLKNQLHLYPGLSSVRDLLDGNSAVIWRCIQATSLLSTSFTWITGHFEGWHNLILCFERTGSARYIVTCTSYLLVQRYRCLNSIYLHSFWVGSPPLCSWG